MCPSDRRSGGELLASILDDCAALGDVNKLEGLWSRWRKRDGVRWHHASEAALCRAIAVRHRLAGIIHFAVLMEDESERHLEGFKSGVVFKRYAVTFPMKREAP